MKANHALFVAIFASGLALSGCRKPHAASTDSAKKLTSAADVTPTKAKALLDSDESITYLDVRTVKEFEASRPAGSRNIPFLISDENGDWLKNADFLQVVVANFEKNAKLVVSCQSGGRSKMAQGVLKNAGFTNLVNMLGGFLGKRSADGTTLHEGWSELKLPTETGPGGAFSYDRLKAKVGE